MKLEDIDSMTIEELHAWVIAGNHSFAERNAGTLLFGGIDEVSVAPQGYSELQFMAAVLAEHL